MKIGKQNKPTVYRAQIGWAWKPTFFFVARQSLQVRKDCNEIIKPSLGDYKVWSCYFLRTAVSKIGPLIRLQQPIVADQVFIK